LPLLTFQAGCLMKLKERPYFGGCTKKAIIIPGKGLLFRDEPVVREDGASAQSNVRGGHPNRWAEEGGHRRQLNLWAIKLFP